MPVKFGSETSVSPFDKLKAIVSDEFWIPNFRLFDNISVVIVGVVDELLLLLSIIYRLFGISPIDIVLSIELDEPNGLI